MKFKSKKNILGAWAFLIGIILALVLGLFSLYLGAKVYTTCLMILVILGIIIGLLNITMKESSKFMLTALTLVVVSYMGQSVMSIIPQVGKILGSLLVLFVPATIIVALKSVFELAKN